MIYPDKALFSFHLKLPLCFTMKAGELHPCYFLKFYSKFFSFKEEIILMIKQEKNTYTSSSSQ